MIKKNHSDILNLLRRFRNKIDSRPPVKQMYEELQMMHIKVRPIQGDINLLDLNNDKLIELLWKLGKLDELFHDEFGKFDPRQKKVLVDFFERMQENFQQQLNKINLKPEQTKIEHFPFFEMEIFKDREKKNRVN